MKKVLFLLLFSTAFGADHLRTLYNTLDPLSVSKSLAFYELYPNRPEGNEALLRASELLKWPRPYEVAKVINLVNRTKTGASELTEEECAIVEQLAAHLPNRRLRGYEAKSEEEVLQLTSSEIDLGKALLLSQLAGQEDALKQARSYSALLDMMALQILARLPQDASPMEKIKATNAFIFEQMHFRFPPQSIYAESIDLFTFLPSVMDDHLGVCLGVTALYLAIAQRIDLPLEIITPPGHIFVRYHKDEMLVNIETTARGIHMPSEAYLGINTRSLEERELREVIGMTHFNQASVYLHSQQFDKAAAAYLKAWPYMEGDTLLSELLGYSYLLCDEDEKGEALLRKVRDHLADHAVQKRALAEDYLEGKTDKEGIRSVFLQVDTTRSSILEKQKLLQEVLQRHPNFRDGLLQSAVCYLQLGRTKEALAQLRKYHVLDPNDPSVEYYLCALNGERHDFKACWEHLRNAERITKSRNFYPKVLRDVRAELIRHCPE
ncbi:MAG: tetratricopeptide repeat protein [Chlamydiales bacterium]|nr:tetratricopeptide repeat protein [Chlamydiales bacterium]